MAVFLDTPAISNELLKIIKEAKETLILISPYLQTTELIKDRIVTKDSTCDLNEFLIIYGKSELKSDEKEWIGNIKSLSLVEKKSLHAKVFLNEEKAIICSMNMYQFSQQNNIEMGVLISKKDDLDAYNALVDEVKNIKQNGVIKKEPLMKKPTDSIEEIPLSKEYFMNQLIEWRKVKAGKRFNLEDVLSENDINTIIEKFHVNDTFLRKVLTAEKYDNSNLAIMNIYNRISVYTYGTIKKVEHKNDDNKYDRVLFFDENGKENWYNTVRSELPRKGRKVAVKLNLLWFNEYIYVD